MLFSYYLALTTWFLAKVTNTPFSFNNRQYDCVIYLKIRNPSRNLVIIFICPEISQKFYLKKIYKYLVWISIWTSEYFPERRMKLKSWTSHEYIYKLRGRFLKLYFRTGNITKGASNGFCFFPETIHQARWRRSEHYSMELRSFQRRGMFGKEWWMTSRRTSRRIC